MSLPATTSLRAFQLRVSYAGCMRLLAYLSGVAVLLCGWSLRRALADSELYVQRLGDSLRAELGPELIGVPEALSINGQILMVASQSSKLAVHDVLNRFEAHCTGVGEDPKEPFRPAALLDVAHARSPKAAALPFFEQLRDVSMQLGVLRSELASEGQLACFARAGERRGLGPIVEDVRAMAETGDLSRLGNLRYVTARKLPNGKTHMVVVWSEGTLRVASLFPETGDAPGTDMQDVPRPTATRRELAAVAVGRSYGLRLYQAAISRDAVLAFYDRELPRKGWQAVPVLPTAGDLGAGLYARAFVRQNRALAIGVRPSGTGAGSAISLVDLGALSRTSAPRDAAGPP